jgi:apolipoprotein N-acyltransferase
MKKIHLILLSVLSGVLLSLTWPANGFPFIIFIALVPILYVEDFICKNKHNFSKAAVFLYSYLAFFIWNILTTWWIINSTVFGAVMAVIFNSLFMALVVWVYHFIRRNLFRGKTGKLILVFLWISFEYLHLDWDLSWSWLNLGNAFAAYPMFIQWYEYTGTLGGTFWVLIVNLLVLQIILQLTHHIKFEKKLIIHVASLALILLLPCFFSLYRYFTYSEKVDPVNIVVVQPNIDPYNEKFGGMTSQQQLDKVIDLAKQKLDQETDFLVCPETAIPEGIVEDELEDSPSIDSINNLIRKFPKLKVVIGISSFKVYKTKDSIKILSKKHPTKHYEEPTVTARYSSDSSYCFDVCNTAIQIDSTKKAQIYHKSKLVPGVEKMPFPKLLKPLEKFAIDLGGMTGSNATQEIRTAFISKNSSVKSAPVICYESIYGEFVTGYIRNGANLIFIITNDGWWGDTPGYKQHFEYARLRSIETRRSIARSANTGISGFINQRGDILFATNYWVDDVIKCQLNKNDKITFYVKFGDYFGRFSLYITGLIFFANLFFILMNMRFRIRFRKKS